MKIGPDGSLPSITSSVKGITNHIKIVKVPDDQVKDSEDLYKLVWIGADDNESETSEKSDEELWSEDDVPNIQLPVENVEKLTDPVSDESKVVEVKIPQNEESMKQQYNRFRKNHNRNNYNSGKRNFNNSGLSKNYNKPIPSNSNVEENMYNSYNSNRNFGSPSNYGRISSAYNQLIPSTSSKDIAPWLIPPAMVNSSCMVNAVPTFQYSTFGYGSVIDHIGTTPPNPENSIGLLGDSPFSLHPPNFQPNNQTDNFRCNQNYWSNDYQEYHPNNYQRSGHGHVRGHSPRQRPRTHKDYYPPRRNWKNRNKPRRNRWERQRSVPEKDRRNANYRN